MKNFKKLVSLCRGGVTLSINNHRLSYETLLYYLKYGPYDETEDIDPNVLNEIVRLDRLVELQFYLNTPVGFYKVIHYNEEAAIEEALAIVEGQTNEKS